jgi:peptide deformylase
VIGEGVLAEALQHEQDHLDGKVYLQRLDPPVRREAMAAVRKAPWF